MEGLNPGERSFFAAMPRQRLQGALRAGPGARGAPPSRGPKGDRAASSGLCPQGGGPRNPALAWPGLPSPSGLCVAPM